jgi:hypothetical protein
VDGGKVREKLDVTYLDLIFISLPHRRLDVVVEGRATVLASCQICSPHEAFENTFP